MLGLGVGEELEVSRQPVLLNRADGLGGRGGGITPCAFGVLKLSFNLADGLGGRGGGITPSTFGVLKLSFNVAEDKLPHDRDIDRLSFDRPGKPLFGRPYKLLSDVRDTDTFSWGSCIKI